MNGFSKREVRRRGTRPVYGRRQPPVRAPSTGQWPRWLRPAAIFLVTLLALIGLAKITALKQVEVKGAKRLSPEHIQSLAKEGLKRQWFGGNTILINGGNLAAYLKKNEPAIKEVKVRRKLPSGVMLSLSERQPSLNWKTGGETYLLDRDGTLIGPSRGAFANLPVVNDTTNVPVKIGDRVVPISFVKFCQEFLGGLTTATSLTATDISVPETTSELYIKTNRDYVIKLDTTRLAAGELNDLAAILSVLSKAKKNPTSYIDLRVEHKAYYK